MTAPGTQLDALFCTLQGFARAAQVIHKETSAKEDTAVGPLFRSIAEKIAYVHRRAFAHYKSVLDC